MNDKNLYLDILEWAYTNSKYGFTEKALQDRFELSGVEGREWYLNMFKESTHGNIMLINFLITRDSLDYYTLSPKGMSEVIHYLNLKEAEKSGKRAEKIALFAIAIGTVVGVIQIVISIF